MTARAGATAPRIDSAFRPTADTTERMKCQLFVREGRRQVKRWHFCRASHNFPWRLAVQSTVQRFKRLGEVAPLGPVAVHAEFAMHSPRT